ncbi:MAG: tRNA lysidine(34) synthetase TilS [Clostridium sp.]
MERETKEYMESHRMTVPGDGVLVGLSGGADSVCLLMVLWCLKKELGIELRALHVHHGLRGAEADRDAEFAEKLCRDLGVDFQEVRIDAAREAKEQCCSVEEAGRRARYRILEGRADAWESEGKKEGQQVLVATAHHAGDSAETILFNLFRGSGLKGLGGIAPVRGRIIRPLLWARRSEIYAYLEEKHCSWREDSTNRENEYSRNRIRNEILPTVRRQINEGAESHILQAGELIRQADDFLEQMAEEKLAGSCLPGSGQRMARLIMRDVCEVNRPEILMDVNRLLDEKPILEGYMIRAALRRLGCSMQNISARHIEAVLLLAGGETGKRLDLPHGILVEKEYGTLRFFRRGSLGEARERRLSEPERKQVEKSGMFLLAEILETGETVRLESGFSARVFQRENSVDFPKNRYTKWFDYDKIKDTLSLRHRQKGDYFALASGGRKSVKSYLVDEKIPRGQRDQIWLLADGSHILWIVGGRISEYYKITDQTRWILQVEYDGGRESG